MIFQIFFFNKMFFLNIKMVEFHSSLQNFNFNYPLKNEDLKDGYIIPDISVKLRDSSWNQPEMIIEVTRDRSWNSDIKKVRKAIKEVRSLKEVFVFNIEETECWRISKPDFDEEDGNCFSSVLKFDLKNCLRG